MTAIIVAKLLISKKNDIYNFYLIILTFLLFKAIAAPPLDCLYKRWFTVICWLILIEGFEMHRTQLKPKSLQGPIRYHCLPFVVISTSSNPKWQGGRFSVNMEANAKKHMGGAHCAAGCAATNCSNSRRKTQGLSRRSPVHTRGLAKI